MMTLGMNIKHPDLFAASFVVAGQWPAAAVAPLARKKLWVVVSQGDDKAYPGENAIMDVITAQGTAVSRATSDGRSTTAQFATDAQNLLADGDRPGQLRLVRQGLAPPGRQHGRERAQSDMAGRVHHRRHPRLDLRTAPVGASARALLGNPPCWCRSRPQAAGVGSRRGGSAPRSGSQAGEGGGHRDGVGNKRRQHAFQDPDRGVQTRSSAGFG